MNPQIVLSLDYELFFGTPTGTVQSCMILPTRELARIARKYNAYLSLFVDVLYLQRMAEEAGRFSNLQQDYDDIRQQLVSLHKDGHDIQLHLHPHWLDSVYDGKQWQIDSSRYKLHDFSDEQIDTIIGSGKSLLRDLVGDSVFAFRAGGWCLQPFSKLAPALQKHDIWLDSTVFPGGKSDDNDRWFDFTSAPRKDYYRFNLDPNKEESTGSFVEVPISAMTVPPSFFWRMALSRKLFRQEQHTPYGDGSSMAWGGKYYFQRLTNSSISVVSVDGMKAGMLKKAYSAEQTSGKRIFHVMGHPKAISRYSLRMIDQFLSEVGDFQGMTFQDFMHLRSQVDLEQGEQFNNKEKA